MRNAWVGLTLGVILVASASGCGEAPSEDVVVPDPAVNAESADARAEEIAASATASAAVEVQEAEPLEGHEAPILAAVFSPDGQLLATADGAGVTIVRNANDFSVVKRIERGIYGVDLAFSPDSSTLSAAVEGNLYTWRRDDQENDVRSTDFRIEAPSETEFAFLDDDRALLARDEAGVALVQLNPPEIVKEFSREGRKFNYVVASPDGKTFVAAGEFDESFCVGDVETGEIVSEVESPGRFHGAAYSPDGSRLAVAGWTRLRILDAESFETLHDVAGPGTGDAIAYSGDGRLVAATFDDKVVLVDPLSGTIVKELATGSEGLFCLAFSPDSKVLIAGTREGQARAWKLSHPAGAEAN